MKNKLSRVLLSSLLALLVGGSAWSAGAERQEAPLMGQTSDDCAMPLPGSGPRPVIADGTATVIRTKNGISAFVRLPTPMPGTYCYPPATLATDPSAGPAVPGHPEVFSLWGIYFNNPENCLPGGCSAADVLGPNCINAQAGAVKLAGHVTGNGTLQLSGHLSIGSGPLGALGCAPLMDPQGAELHVAVGPHGMLVPSLMPAQISVPPGGGPGYWFPAIFLPLP